ncbi:lipid IV(A) 3-deoxy-D-manno-octulosonic acid transferase [Vibrio japonicus]|uniref:3-deoxy-D-manno-octulosonic acid transferase n=1 Tax=Vibrio japonicus TaxID=1824638 RepID=A0ABY5LEM4_9VIBR|nr:lipid IV(A) 3-deoxy-D-manno-octulosonic acid transferase [Vibrio japonicus]UUM30482.1 lipid IV(A) 3-deoxy-D-manno-octulosonic acid transferase [Vibrio japonicus]
MKMLVRYCYTLLLALVSPVLLWGLYRSRPNKPSFGSRWREHFGITPELESHRSGVIWLHAVSVGEVLASRKLISQLQERYPEKAVLVTTTTSTGAQQVENMGNGIVHRYMPIDFSWCVRRFLRTVKPEIMLIIETEIWPNTIHTVSKQSIPIVLVNGRLSEKSLSNYQKLSLLIQPALSSISSLLSVHSDDAKRFIGLGVEAEKVTTTGSLKYDISVEQQTYDDASALRKQLGESRKVWIAASTHLGEDEFILAAYKLAKEKIPDLLLILVPRHPERFDSVAELIQSQGLSCVRRSQGRATELSKSTDVYLGDSMGEMMILLAASDLVFMGGSLLGKKVGGHNFIEPAVLSKPCLTGPSYYNFADLADQLIGVGMLTVVSDSEQLAEKVVKSLSSPETLSASGKAGYDIVLRNQGALKRTVNSIASFIH